MLAYRSSSRVGGGEVLDLEPRKDKEMKRQQQLELGRELGEQLDSNSLDRVVSILIEWGLIEADLASQIIAEKVGA